MKDTRAAAQPGSAIHRLCCDTIEQSARTRKVLIVDDNEDIRLLFRIAVEASSDLEVWGEAANGMEALDQLDRGCPEIILLDIMMPVMDGVTALPLLRDRCPSSMIVIVTAMMSDTSRSRLYNLGAAEVYEKQSVPELMGMLSAL